MNEPNEKILNHLMETAYESGADEDNPYMTLLHIIVDMEYRIKALETKSDSIPMPIFSGIPNSLAIPFMTINEIREKKMRLPPLEREEIGFPPIEASKELNENERSIYNHLVSKGCSWEDAVDIAREIEEIGHGK
jgi:hypothetical protein